MMVDSTILGSIGLTLIIEVAQAKHQQQQHQAENNWQGEEAEKAAAYYFEKYGPPPWMYKRHRTLLQNLYHYGGIGLGILAAILIGLFIYSTVTYMKSYFKQNVDLSKFQVDDNGVSVNVNVRNRPLDEYVNDTKKLIEKSAKKFSKPGVYQTVTEYSGDVDGTDQNSDLDADSLSLNGDDGNVDEPTRKRRHRIRRAFSKSSRHSDT